MTTEIPKIYKGIIFKDIRLSCLLKINQKMSPLDKLLFRFIILIKL